MHAKKGILPIVFIHIDDSEYLKYTLAQARIQNPDAPIYLIGDEHNNNYEFVIHYNLNNFSSEAELFSKLYKHHSINSSDGELFCFRRWFVLKEFMERNDVPKCLYLDSDVLLFADIRKESMKYRNFDFTLSLGFSPGFNLVHNTRVLNDFCDFILKCFISQPLYKKLVKTADQEPWSQGSVSDMVAFFEYQKQTPYKIGDISLVINKTKHDININLSEGFDMETGVKKITWIDDKPYCRDISSGSLVRFNSLHFQGGAKPLIKDHFRGELYYSQERSKWFIRNHSIGMPRHSQSFHEDISLLEDIQKCKIMLASNNFKEAREAIEEAIKKYPLLPDILVLYGELLWKSDELDDADKLLTYITKRWPDHIKALKNLAFVKLYGKQWDDAIRLMQEILKINPMDPEAMENLIFMNSEISVSKAKELIGNKDLLTAKKLLEEVLTLNHNHIEALNNLVKILMLEDNFTEAENTLSLILELDPGNETARTILKDLEGRKADH